MKELFHYKMPSKYKDLIDNNFEKLFIENLKKQFKDTGTPIDDLIYLEGTCGYNDALRETCTSLNLNELIDYYDKLPWHESDLFDSELMGIVVEKIKEKD